MVMGEDRTKKSAAQAPLKAVTHLVTDEGWVLGLATENEAGYNRLSYGPFDTEEEARALSDHINKTAYGLTPARALMVVSSSMFPAPPAAHAKRRKEWPT
jgi:hypothetical protein